MCDRNQTSAILRTPYSILRTSLNFVTEYTNPWSASCGNKEVYSLLRYDKRQGRRSIDRRMTRVEAHCPSPNPSSPLLYSSTESNFSNPLLVYIHSIYPLEDLQNSRSSSLSSQRIHVIKLDPQHQEQKSFTQKYFPLSAGQ